MVVSACISQFCFNLNFVCQWIAGGRTERSRGEIFEGVGTVGKRNCRSSRVESKGKTPLAFISIFLSPSFPSLKNMYHPNRQRLAPWLQTSTLRNIRSSKRNSMMKSATTIGAIDHYDHSSILLTLARRLDCFWWFLSWSLFRSFHFQIKWIGFAVWFWLMVPSFRFSAMCLKTWWNKYPNRYKRKRKMFVISGFQLLTRPEGSFPLASATNMHDQWLDRKGFLWIDEYFLRNYILMIITFWQGASQRGHLSETFCFALSWLNGYDHQTGWTWSFIDILGSVN